MPWDAGLIRVLQATSSLVDAWKDGSLGEWFVVDDIAVLRWEHDILTGKVVLEVTAVLDSATGEVRPLPPEPPRVRQKMN